MSYSALASHGSAVPPVDLTPLQPKNAGVVTNDNATTTSEADRAAGGIQVQSHSRYGGTVDKGKSVLIAAMQTASNGSALKIFRMIEDGSYTNQPMLSIGVTGDFAELFGSTVVTANNTATLSNKVFDKPRESSVSLAEGVNTINIMASTRIKARPNGIVTLTVPSIDDSVNDNHSCVLLLYPSASVSFAASAGLVWGTSNGAAPTLAANKVQIITLTFMHYQGVLARWLAVPGPIFTP